MFLKTCRKVYIPLKRDSDKQSVVVVVSVSSLKSRKVLRPKILEPGSETERASLE